MRRLEPEFLLLVRCCQWNFAGAGEASPLEIPPACDWTRVVALARRHRVQGLAWNALAPLAGQIPEADKEALSSDARSIAVTNLGIAAECSALCQSFDKAKVHCLFVKGLSLAALAYRSPLLKMGWDIDLLIDPPDLEKASNLLAGLGYDLRLPANIKDLEGWHKRSKESVWQKGSSYFVELHTRLADNQRLIATIDAQSPRQLVEVTPSVLLPTLTRDELLAYLAVHGASSAWFRLKWISDFAALLQGSSADELERAYSFSQQLGAARAFGQALLLADTLFNILEPAPSLRKELISDPATRLLSRAALQLMTNGVSEPTERRFGTLSIHWTQFLLQPGLGFKLSELRRQFGLLRLPH